MSRIAIIEHGPRTTHIAALASALASVGHSVTINGFGRGDIYDNAPTWECGYNWISADPIPVQRLGLYGSPYTKKSRAYDAVVQKRGLARSRRTWKK